MKNEELNVVRAKVKKFLKDNSKVLKIDYLGKDLNPAKYYHSIMFQNTLVFFIKFLVFGICYFLPASEFKNFFYRMFGMKIGKEVSISGGVRFDIGFPQLISIGDGAIIGTGVTILTHEITSAQVRIGRVTVGKRSLVGVNSVVRSGVSIGNGAIVAIGSVVNKDVQDYELVGGVPAERIKKLSKTL